MDKAGGWEQERLKLIRAFSVLGSMLRCCILYPHPRDSAVFPSTFQIRKLSLREISDLPKVRVHTRQHQLAFLKPVFSPTTQAAFGQHPQTPPPVQSACLRSLHLKALLISFPVFIRSPTLTGMICPHTPTGSWRV